MVWLFVVVPLQYFFFLVSGAPARLALKAGIEPVAVRASDREVHVSAISGVDTIEIPKIYEIIVTFSG